MVFVYSPIALKGNCAVKPFLQTMAFVKILNFTVFRSGAVHAGTDVFHLILTGSNN